MSIGKWDFYSILRVRASLCGFVCAKILTFYEKRCIIGIYREKSILERLGGIICLRWYFSECSYFSRSFLRFAECSTAQANVGFLKSMTFSYIKDISYKCFCNSIEEMMHDISSCAVDKVLERINNGLVITSFKPYAASSHGDVRVSDFRYPWNRQFEMNFDIKISAKTGK